MLDMKSGKPRQTGSTLSLGSLLYSMSLVADYPLHNAGNDAFACLLALQKLLDPDNTKVPRPRVRNKNLPLNKSMCLNPATISPMLTPPLISSPVMRSFPSTPRQLSPNDSGDAKMSGRSSGLSPNFLTGADPRQMGVAFVDEQGRIRRSPSTPDLRDTKAMSATIG